MKKPINNSIIKNDQTEELHYGPGIVSKLRCRYMNLTLNQGCTKQRASLNYLRRSTSLNNIIDTSEPISIIDENIKIENNSYSICQRFDTKTQSCETLLETNKHKNVGTEHSKNDNENEQPPTDVVKEKLRIFEPNWINSKKKHFYKKDVGSKHYYAPASNKISNNNENNEEFNDYKSFVNTNRQSNPPIKNIATSTFETHNAEIFNNAERSIEAVNIKKSCHKIHDNQSIIFNFSKRKEHPSYLPVFAQKNEENYNHVSNFTFIQIDTWVPKSKILN